MLLKTTLLKAPDDPLNRCFGVGLAEVPIKDFADSANWRMKMVAVS